MNILPLEQQAQVIAALTEGVSIRASERLTGIHRDTIMRMGVRVGNGCVAINDGIMRGLEVGRLELDETCSYVGKKQRQLKEGDSADLGDQYVFLNMADSAKAIVSYTICKRTAENTRSLPCRFPRPRRGSPGDFGRWLPSLSRGL